MVHWGKARAKGSWAGSALTCKGDLGDGRGRDARGRRCRCDEAHVAPERLPHARRVESKHVR